MSFLMNNRSFNMLMLFNESKITTCSIPFYKLLEHLAIFARCRTSVHDVELYATTLREPVI